LGSQRIVNVGAVGIPFNSDPRAQYGLFTLGPTGHWEVELRAIEYDREPVRHAFESGGYLDAGTVARIFLHEYLEARSFLYLFERWAEDNDLPKVDSSWQRFLAL
jgi:hypothetical protein